MPNKHRLLLVEDEPDDFELLSRRLEKLPIARFDIRNVKRLAQATALLSAETMDAIILDLNLPDSAGLQTLSGIKAVAGEAPIIVVSGLINEQMRQAVLNAGAAEAVTKEEANSLLFPRAILYIIERDRAITHQRAAEKAKLEEGIVRLEEASRLKSDFLANVSHELRTPLNAIIGFSKLLYAGKVGALTETQTEYLGDVLKSADHLLQIINDILDLAKVEAGRIDVRVETVDLSAAIREVRDVLRGGAADKRILVEVEIDRHLKTVDTDPRLFKQVLYNYLSNAIKFTPEDGRIDLRAVAEHDETFRLEVADSGPGIRPDDLGRLFVEFQQLVRSGETRNGTGLGLALSKRIVEALGGKVDVHSVLGQGSVFSATFPCIVTRSASLVFPVRNAGTPPSPVVTRRSSRSPKT